MENLSDDELFDLVKSGGPGAFDAIAARYQGMIKGFIKNCLAARGLSWEEREETARDLTQNVWMKIFEHRAKYRGGNFKAWILTIAANEVKNWQRRAASGERAMTRFAKTEELEEEDIEAAVLLRERLKETVDALKNIAASAGEKRTLLLAIFTLIMLGWGFLEIYNYIRQKDLTNMTPGAFKTFLFRARRNIKKRVEKE